MPIIVNDWNAFIDWLRGLVGMPPRDRKTKDDEK